MNRDVMFFPIRTNGKGEPHGQEIVLRGQILSGDEAYYVTGHREPTVVIPPSEQHIYLSKSHLLELFAEAEARNPISRTEFGSPPKA